MVSHCRGFHMFISDYIHSPALLKILHGALLAGSTAAFGGLLYLNYYDVGLSQAILLLYGKL